MKRAWLLVLAAVVLASAVAVADDDAKPRRRVRLGGISVGAGYSHMSGPWSPYGYYPYYGPAWRSAWNAPWMNSYWFDPWFMTPYVHPAFYTGFGYGPGLGEVRVRYFDKAADVFIDGALAGKAGKLKSMWLEPGAYELTVKQADQTEYSRKIYVLTGKRFDIEAERSQR